MPLRRVNLGPQSVQVVKGYMCLRPAENISRTHLSQTALSAGIDAPVPSPEERTIENPFPPVYGTSDLVTDLIDASGGRSDMSDSRSSSPLSVSMTTEDPSFHTAPDAPTRSAAR